MDNTPHAPYVNTQSTPGGVRITGIDIGIGELIVLMIKVAIASIPAGIIIMVVFAIIGAIFGGIFAGLMGGLGS
ncbi:MAG TPA: hypothetical protein VF584_05980 [Longimicrobium sp.]|jgi:hypothetical protein